MRKRKFLYMLSWALMALLIILAILGPYIKPHSIEPSAKVFWMDNPNPESIHKKLAPPFKPDNHYILGSDPRGYDVLSLLLNGMRYTLGIALLITIGRFLLAIPLGMYVGATGRFKSLLSSLQWVTSAVPPLVFVYPGLLALFYGLEVAYGIPTDHPNQIIFNAIFVIAVVFIGVFPIAQQFADRSRFWNEKLFVTASSLLGASIIRRIIRHIFPSVRSEVLFAFLADYVQVLFLMGQLAVLGIFIGGGEVMVFQDGFATYSMAITKSGEWLGLLAYGIQRYRIYPWIIVSVLVFFVASVAIVQFFLHQQKKEFVQR
ncbi:hypothetical protein NV379_16195 [Paenibacillus sp. N1-5-1-14]|uniref:hypothetical protein n=1 Tax=Paenibacillus radicibacter TaxID=2972488 RepID=UPI002158F107|nr:hypothetical protein [Paenibacillus radicibacter]MCR8644195.1 hypothetical protein [Paenibacillus radicibacter]